MASAEHSRLPSVTRSLMASMIFLSTWPCSSGLVRGGGGAAQVSACAQAGARGEGGGPLLSGARRCAGWGVLRRGAARAECAAVRPRVRGRRDGIVRGARRRRARAQRSHAHPRSWPRTSWGGGCWSAAARGVGEEGGGGVRDASGRVHERRPTRRRLRRPRRRPRRAPEGPHLVQTRGLVWYRRFCGGRAWA